LLCLQAWIGELERDRSETTLEEIFSHSLSSEKNERERKEMENEIRVTNPFVVLPL
jgi:hypothetical protein